MAWSIDVTNAKFGELNTTEQANWNCFVAQVTAGNHPKTASEQCGDMKYTLLKGTKNQFEIRLSGGERATFIVNKDTETVEVLQVGGHT